MVCSSITITSSGGPTQDLSQTISGSVHGIAAGTSVLVYENGASTPVGSAVVQANGTWSAEIILGLGASVVDATAIDAAGHLRTSNSVDYSLVPVISPPSNGAAHDPVEDPVPGRHHVFAFGAAPGQVLLDSFRALGRNHDVVELPSSQFASIADVLRDIHGSGHGAVLTFPSHGEIEFSGVSARELRAHPGDFRFHHPSVG